MSASKFFPRSTGNFVTRNEFLTAIELLSEDIENLVIDISGIISDLSFGEANKVVFRDNSNDLNTDVLFGYDGETLTIGLDTKTATFIPNLKLEVSGGVYLKGDVLINGSLDVMGDMTTINTINLDISANKITLNKGLSETGLPPTMMMESGFIIERGTEEDYHIFYKEACKSLHVGLSGETLFPLTEREEEMTEGSILVWTRRIGYPTCNGYLREVEINWDVNRLKIDNTLDMSCNMIIDVSNILFCNGMNLLDTLDSSFSDLYNRLDSSFSDVYNRLDSSFSDVYNILDSSFSDVYNILDSSFSDVYNRVDVIDVSVSDIYNTLDVSFGDVYNRVDVIDVSVSDLYDIKYDKTGGLINGNVSISGELDMCCNIIKDVSSIFVCGTNVRIGQRMGAIIDNSSIAIGIDAGQGQAENSVAIGHNAGRINQQKEAIAVGFDAGTENQGEDAIAFGQEAGNTDQGERALAFGYRAGSNNQGTHAIALGDSAGRQRQCLYSLALGNNAGETDQSCNTIAIGRDAGRIRQGTGSIAIGRNAGYEDQHPRSIIINATDISLNTEGTERLYIKPIREKNDLDVSGILTYDASGEITNNTTLYNAVLDVCYNSVWRRDTSGNIYYVPELLAQPRQTYGYVGIGTSNPLRPIHLVQYQNGQTTMAFQQFDTTVNQANVLSFRDASFIETGAIAFGRPVPLDASRNRIGFFTRSREFNGVMTENVSVDGITLEVRKIASFIESDAVDISDNVIIRGTLDMCCNTVIDVSGIYFCDGTYIGHGESFDISANQVLVLSGVQDACGNYNGASVVSKNRIYQQLNEDFSWNVVNGYYGLAKDAYPAVSEAAAEKAVNEWNLRNAVNNTLSWRRVKWIPELGQFLAVPNNSTTLQISNNGINWTPVTAGFSYAYRQIAWSKELNRVVVGNTGNPAVNRLAYSDDLINWNYTDISNNRFESVVWASEIGLFVASSSLDTLLPFNRILTSPDGITWTKQTSVDDSEPWRPLCWSAELGILVNLVNKANLTVTSKLQISKDGINWTEYPLLTEGNWTDMVWSKELGIFVVVSDTFLGSVGNQPSKIITSPDGINWTERINPDTTIDWFGIEWSPELGLFVVVGSKTGGSTMMASSNGIDWKIYTNFDSTKAWASISWSAELGIFVACALSGTGERLITSSLKGRPPTSYNVFDSSFNNIDSSGNWTLKVKELNGNVEISGNLSLNCNLINDVSGINFCDGTYIGHGESFDISTNEVLKIYSGNGISQIINTAGDTLLLDGETPSNLTERGEKLQIHSLSAAGSAAGFYCYDAATSNSTRLEFYKNESGNITGNSDVSSNSSALGFIGFQGMSSSGYLRGATIIASTEDTNVATALRFLTKGTTGSSTERMRINSSGNVGIGTINPTNKLVIQNGNYSMTDTGYTIGTTTNNFGMIMEVSGNVGNSAALWIKNDTPSAPVSTLLRVENNGNVGIGTAPTTRLEIDGNTIFRNTASSTLLKESYGRAVDGAFIIDRNYVYNDNEPPIQHTIEHEYQFGIYSLKYTNQNLTTTNILQYSNQTGTINIQTNGPNNRIVIDGNGRVGIGNITPNSTLDVNGVTTLRGQIFHFQPTPIARNATITLATNDILIGIITSNPTAAITLTLPSATSMNAITNPTPLTDSSIDWTVINLSGANTITIGTATGHTIVGRNTVLGSISGRFRSRRTGTTTWVSYRIS
jgi:hypothetical protein